MTRRRTIAPNDTSVFHRFCTLIVAILCVTSVVGIGVAAAPGPLSQEESPTVTTAESQSQSVGSQFSTSKTPENASSGPASQTIVTNITLITGQTVQVIQQDGRTVYQIQANATMHKVATKQGVYIYPDGVDFKKFDRALFNVELLREQGLTDNSSTTIPLIVRKKSDNTRFITPNQTKKGTPIVQGISGTSDIESLPSIGAEAAHVAKSQTKQAYTELRTNDKIERVTLDVKIRVALDETNERVNADSARQQYNVSGEGVTVAVVDSGIDNNHTDIDQIAAEKDFTGEATTGDPNGHGTHVAGIIAGDGSASNGQYVGMAPNATLLDARVMGDDGFGETSDIIRGMNWSVANGADIISMSIGGSATSVRTNDPYRDAVQYATENGVTVAIAAGNSAWHTTEGYRTMESPGIMKNAITVGATNKTTGEIAEFSSRGPTPMGFFVKPNVVAPGTNVVSTASADAGYTSSYVSKSGTSMATPVVSGIAALALQNHPGWSPQQVKAAVVSTADPISGYDVYQQGAGRINATDVIGTDIVVTPGTTSFGTYTSNTTVNRTIQITNRGNTSKTLNLSAAATNINTGTAGAVSLNQSTVTLTSGESVRVNVTVNTSTERGVYSGRISLDKGNYTAIFGYVRATTLTLTKDSLGSTDAATDKIWVIPHQWRGDFQIRSYTQLQNGSVTYPVVEGGNYTVVSTGVNEQNGQAIILSKNFTVGSSDTTVALDEDNTVTYTLNTSAVPEEEKPLATRTANINYRVTTPSGLTMIGEMTTFEPTTTTVRFSPDVDLNATLEHLLVPDTQSHTSFDRDVIYDVVNVEQSITANVTRAVDPAEMGQRKLQYFRATPNNDVNAILASYTGGPREEYFRHSYGGYLGDRQVQSIYISPVVDRFGVSLASHQSNVSWRLGYGYASMFTPDPGTTQDVEKNVHPFLGRTFIAADESTNEFGFYQYPQDGGQDIFYDERNDTVSLAINNSLVYRNNVTYGAYFDSRTIAPGSTVEIETIGRNDGLPMSTKTVMRKQFVYEPGTAFKPPYVHQDRLFTVTNGSTYSRDLNNSVPDGNTTIEYTVEENTTNISSVTVVYALDRPSTHPFNDTGVKTGTTWKTATVNLTQSGPASEYQASFNTTGYQGYVSVGFRVETTDGEITEQVTYDGFGVQTAESFTTDDNATLRGTFHSANETALVGDQVHISTRNDFYHSSTDTNGTFTQTVQNDTRASIGYYQDGGINGTALASDGVPDLYFSGRAHVVNTTDIGNVTLPAGHRVNVTVLNESGEPVENARVGVRHYLSGHNGSWFGLGNSTNADGQFVQRGASKPGVELVGNVTVVVKPPKNSSEYTATTYSYDLNITQNETLAVTLNETSNVTLTGRMVTSDGTPVTNATVLASNETFHSSATNATGGFEMTVPDNRSYSTAVAQDRSENGGPIMTDGVPETYTLGNVPVTGSTNLSTVTLPTAYRVNITVVGENGDPIENASVDPFHHSSSNYSDGWSSVDMVTNADGVAIQETATRTGVELVGNVSFYVTRPDGATQYEKRTTVWTEINATSQKNYTVVLNQNETNTSSDGDEPRLHGQIVYPDGTSASHGITLTNESHWQYNQTASDGTVNVSLPANGTYELAYYQAYAEGNFGPRDGLVDLQYFGMFDVNGSTNISTQTVSPGHVLNVTVVNETGNPVTNASIGYDVAPSVGTGGYQTLTNDEGMAYNTYSNVTGLEVNGSVRITVEPPENSTQFKTQTITKNITVSNDTEVNVTLDETDQTAPEITSSLNGTEGANGWYTSDVTMNLTASDTESGVDRIVYSLDETQTWLTYDGPYTFSDDGNYTTEFTAYDDTGNRAQNKTVRVRIDTHTPNTTATLSGTTGANGWYTSNVTVSLAATDATSGVHVTRYRIDGGSWQTYNGSVTLTTDGNHSIEYYSVDEAGNEETDETTTVKVDTTAPTVDATALNQTDDILPEHPIEVSVTASDTQGVDSVVVAGTSLKQTDGSWSGTVTAAPQLGNHTFTVVIRDKAGNERVVETATYSVGRDATLNVSENGTLSANTSDSNVATVTVNATNTTENATVTVGTAITNPTTTDPAGTSLYFPQINTTISNENITGATVTLTVEKSRIQEQYVVPDTVTFWVENESGPGWEQIDGHLVTESANTYTYEIAVPHFSAFAITGETESTAPTITTFDTASDAPTPGNVTLSASYGDNYSGINPANVTLTIHSTDMTADASVTADGLTITRNLTAGTYNATLIVADNADNSRIEKLSFTVTDESDESGGSSSGGGGSADVPPPPLQVAVEQTDMGVRLDIKNARSSERASAPLTGVTAGNVTVDHVALGFASDDPHLIAALAGGSGLPSGTTRPGVEAVLGHVTVSTQYAPASVVGEAVYQFEVAESALPAGTTLNDVTVYQYANGSWTEVHVTRQATTFTATMSQFTTVAVVVESSNAETTTTTVETTTTTTTTATTTTVAVEEETATETRTASDGGSGGIPGFGMSSTLIALIAAALLALRQRT